MSDRSQGPGWWLASDGRWYPPPPAGTAAPARRVLPFWVLILSIVVIAGAPATLVLGLLSAGLYWVYLSILLAVLTPLALAALVIGIVQRRADGP